MKKITLFMIFSLITCAGCSKTLYKYNPRYILLTDEHVECVSDEDKDVDYIIENTEPEDNFLIDKDVECVSGEDKGEHIKRSSNGKEGYKLYFKLDNKNIWPGIFIGVYAMNEDGEKISAVVEGIRSNCGSFDFGAGYEVKYKDRNLPATRFSWRPDYTKRSGRRSYNCPIVDPAEKLLPEHEEKVIALKIKDEKNKVIGCEKLHFELLKREDEETTSCSALNKE